MTGDLSNLSARVTEHAMKRLNPERFQNHRIVLSGWGDDSSLSIEAERLETTRETLQRVLKEEQIQADHEQWLIKREQQQRELYERLKQKYGDA